MASNNTTESSIINYNISDDICPHWTQTQAKVAGVSSWWLEGVIQLFLTILGLLANSLSIFILTRKILSRQTFNQLLTALAVFDSTYLLLMFLESFGHCLTIPGWDWIHGLLTPQFLYPVKAIAMTGSVYMMMSVGLERYIAVYHPFSRIPSSLQSPIHGKRCLNTRLMVYLLPVILFAVLFNIPKFFESKYDPDPEHGKYVVITDLRTDATYLMVISWARLVFLGIFPVVVISILNYKIFLAIRKSNQGRQGDDTLSIVLFFIVVIFLICSIPRLIILMFDVTILKRVKICKDINKMAYPFWNIMLGFFSHVLLVLNPFLNFIVYCCIGKTFRRVASEYLCQVAPCLAPYLPTPTSRAQSTTRRNTQRYPGSLKTNNTNCSQGNGVGQNTLSTNIDQQTFESSRCVD